MNVSPRGFWVQIRKAFFRMLTYFYLGIIWTLLVFLVSDVARGLAFASFVSLVILSIFLVVALVLIFFRLLSAYTSKPAITMLRLGLSAKTAIALTLLTFLYIPVCRKLAHAWRHVYNDPAFPQLPGWPQLRGRSCYLEEFRPLAPDATTVILVALDEPNTKA
jgi:hypothetical protein